MSRPDDISLSPIDWVKKLILDGMTFDHAFVMVNNLYYKQHGRNLPRDKIAKAVMAELEKEVK